MNWRRLGRWAPALLWMAGILFFSSRAQPLGPLSRSSQGGLIGRAAHVGEYVGLSFFLYFALASGRRRGARLALDVLLLAGACAAGDEFFQGFMPGRERALSDLAWDLGGISAGLMLGLVVERIRATNGTNYTN